MKPEVEAALKHCENLKLWVSPESWEAIRTLTTTLKEAEADRWQPIETAPKDGRTLLLGYPNRLGHWRTVRGQWYSEQQIQDEWEEYGDCEPSEREGWYETSVEADDFPSCWPIKPTHWQPLPQPPAAAGKEPE